MLITISDVSRIQNFGLELTINGNLLLSFLLCLGRPLLFYLVVWQLSEQIDSGYVPSYYLQWDCKLQRSFLLSLGVIGSGIVLGYLELRSTWLQYVYSYWVGYLPCWAWSIIT